MELFLQATAAALIAVILTLAIEKQGKELTILLTVAVCCMIALVAVSFFRHVMNFMEKLESIGNLNASIVSTLLRILGIGMIGEIAAMVCADAGNQALAKALELLGASVTLYLSIPVFTALIELVQEILGQL